MDSFRFLRYALALLGAATLAALLGVLLEPDLAAVEPSPVAQFTYEPPNPAAGQLVQFTDLSTNTPTSWSWTFGDGGTSTVQNPTHVFTFGGQYRVKLSASNTSGSSLGEHTVTVAATQAGTVGGCDYYAAPAGAGDGLSLGTPFKVADFWPVASPGKTLCLLDGVYDDAESMITPPAGLSGVAGSPIVVKALYDGGALISGRTVRNAVLLRSNDWFVVEGINACCANNTVVGLDHSSHDIIRRVAAWDAAEGNYSIFGVHYGDHNLLEDVAGWGIARKIFESSQGGDFTTIRRAWGRWEGSHIVGPKMVYSLAYNNYDMLIENAIGTWSGEKMKQTYVLLDSSGQAWLGNGGGTYTNFDVNQPYGIFSNDGLAGDKNARARLLGSIAYVGKNDVFKADKEIFITSIDSVDIKDTAAAFLRGGVYAGKHTIGLYGLTSRTENGGETNVHARDLTSISADSLGNQIGVGWQQEDIFQSQDASSGSLYSGAQGADLCHQYLDGTITDRPLWPWPMNWRISDAMIRSGRAPVDVTKAIERISGPIPIECRAADLLVPVFGHVRGAGGELFTSDLHVYNPSSRPAHARLLFQPSGGDRPYRVNLEIAPGETLNSRDAVRDLFGLDAAIGSLVLQTDAAGDEAPRASARILSSRDNGTMGLSLTSAPVPASTLSSTAFVTGLAATASYRSNLGAVNVTDREQIFEIVLRSRDGSVLQVGPPVHLGPGVPLQWSLGTLFPGASGIGLLAEFHPEAGSVTPVAYGTLVDNASGDSTFHPAMTPLSTLYLPAIGHVVGASGLFLTDLSISNASQLTIHVEATFLDHDGSNGGSRSLLLTLDPHQTIWTADALGDLFGLTESYGALRLTTSDGSPSLVASARIYTASLTTGGTVGQQINAIATEDLRAAGSLLGLEQDQAFRSNIAFFNPGDSQVPISIELQDPAGHSIANRILTIPPSSYLQRSLPALFPSTSFPSDASLTASFQTSAERVFVFASVIDNRTGDPSFFPSVP